MKLNKVSCVVFIVFLTCFLMSCSSQSRKKAAVFYHSYNDDEYTKKLRLDLNDILKEDANIVFENYNAKKDQKTQTEQIESEIEKGTDILMVNMLKNSSRDDAEHIVDIAKNADIPLIFFGRPVDAETLEKYEKSLYIGGNYIEAAQVQGTMIGKFLLRNYDFLDLNKDGKISYIMFMEEDYERAVIHEKYCIENIDTILSKKGKPAIEYYDEEADNKYFMDNSENKPYQSAYDHMIFKLQEYNESNNNMIELVISNSDYMALGAIEALQKDKYNTLQESKTIPVFGIGATTEAQSAIQHGIMAGTVKQNTEYMAEIIEEVCTNILSGKDAFDNVDKNVISDKNRIFIPYKEYL